MQAAAKLGTSPAQLSWFKTRTVVSGLFLVGLAGLYFVLTYPIAEAEVPIANFRFPFSFIATIYAIDLTLVGIDYFYRTARPPKPSPAMGRFGKLDITGMVLRSAFMLTVGGSYLTGAMVATPTVFQPLAPTFLVGASVPIFADYLHSIFALLLIAFGAAIIIFEVSKIATHRSTWRNWLVNARYREIKILYWLIAIAVIAQGTVGLFLLGTFSPVGPYGLLGPNAYDFEYLIRHIHGPLGAAVFAIFTNHIYYRLMPGYQIK